MANEITLLDARQSPTDGAYINVCFRYDIAVPKQVGGTSVVVTPASTLPTLAAQALSAVDKTALDAGAAAFEVIEFHYDATETTARNVVRLRALFAAQKAQFDVAYARRLARAGTQLNAV